jgi:hypothetical protein
MTKLRDLDAQFVTIDGESLYADRPDLTLAEAQGVRFDDPVNGTCVVAWFVGVPQDVLPHGGRWAPSGTGLDDLTLQPSIDLTCGGKYPGQWHGWVRNGDAS